MRTLLRRIILIFIILVIAFFLYSAIDPTGSSKLISWIKGETGSVLVTTGAIINLDEGMSPSGQVIVISNTGVTNTKERTRSEWRSGTGSSATFTGVSLISVGSSGNSLSKDFLDAVAAPGQGSGIVISVSTGGSLSGQSVSVSSGSFQVSDKDMNTNVGGKSHNNIVSQKIESTSTTTIITTVVENSSDNSPVVGTEQEITDNFFRGLVDGVVQ